MSKVVGAIAAAMALTAVAGAQEIGRVTLKPKLPSGEMYADLPTRPEGEKVFIVRGSKVVAEATIKSSGKPGGSVLDVVVKDADKVRIGDIISLSEDPKAPLATPPVVAAVPPSTGLPAVSSLDAVPPSTVAPAPPVALPSPTPMASVVTSSRTTAEKTSIQLEKGEYEKTVVTDVQAVSPRLTPRGTGITVYPRPAVQAEAAITAPYGVGLAAAAPVGTPYLRSPAFAGPPVIYMPQTVTRVLLPGVTPYPANIMAPPTRYAYASAPFQRTDIYVSLPYGTFYWPQGYAGTTPVEPQVPAYVLAPASAIQTNENSYAVQRYAPGLANPETLSPITVAAPAAPLTGAVAVAGPQPAITGLTPAPIAAYGQIPAVVPNEPAGPIGSELSTVGPAGVDLQPMQPFPSVAGNPDLSTGTGVPASIGGPAPLALTPAPTPLTEVVAVPPGGPTEPAVAGLPTLESIPSIPAATPAVSLPPPGSSLPSLTDPSAAAPSAIVPSVPAPDASAGEGIVIDDKTPGAITVEPAGAWENSVNLSESYEQSSLYARADGTRKTATFTADVPAAGEYEIFMWWVASNKQFRSASVPVIVQTASGPQTVTVDQTNTQSARRWNSIGRFQLAAGEDVPVVTVSTEGINPGDSGSVSVSVDAVKLVKVQ